MLEKLKHPRRWLVAGGLLVAGAAYSSPWDIDMVDSRSFKAYEWKMMPPIPEGSLQRPAGAVQRAKPIGSYQNDYIAPIDRNDDSTESVVNPYPVDKATIAQGTKLFQVSCAPCHGEEGKGGGPVTHNDPAAGMNRFVVPAPMLSGDGAVAAIRSDGYIYGTIRNGDGIMPRYGISLTDRERWSIVAYIRTLDGAAYKNAVPVVPAAPVAPVPDPKAAKPLPGKPALPKPTPKAAKPAAKPVKGAK